MDQLIDDFLDCDLADPRRTKRLVAMVQQMSQKPKESFPEIYKAAADLEGAYRFVNNPYVSWWRLLEPHCSATAARAALHQDVVVAHDTTEFDFSGNGDIEGIGRLPNNRQGFFGHFAFALSTTAEMRLPLGVLGMELINRLKPAKGKQPPAQAREDPENEHKRWGRLLNEVGTRLREHGASAIHVMDRESDDYGLFCEFIANEHRFVTRLAHNRPLAGIHTSVFSALEKASAVITREASLSPRRARGSKARRIHPSRAGRLVQLAFAATPIELKRPKHALRSTPAALSLNLVRVWELDVPEGEQGVEWHLLTSEPIDTPDAITKAIDTYRARWTIEEFNKAIKTGCSFEKRQFESSHSLFNTLVITLPVAADLLRLRAAARGPAAESPATILFEPDALQALAAQQPKESSRWSDTPNIRQVMLTIAAAGGHIKHNGDPGWQVLGRGYLSFLQFYAGWRAARQTVEGSENEVLRKSKICDQS